MSQSPVASTPSPIVGLDPSSAGEVPQFLQVNGHIETTFHQSTGTWTPLRFVADPYLRIHGLAPGLNYGQQAFEGLKAFRLPSGGVALFRPDANALRLQHSARVLNMPPVPVAMFISACRAAVAHNKEYVPPHASLNQNGGGGGSGGNDAQALYCRPLLFASGPMFPPGVPDVCTFAVFVFRAPHHPSDPLRALVLDDFDRAAPRGTGTAKAGGNYPGVFRWSSRAREEGFGTTLHLDSVTREYVDEFSLCGFLGVVAGEGEGGAVALVVPESSCAIDSLTSDCAQQIARSWGWEVVRRPVRYTELPGFSEVIGAGTAMGLVPIRSITRRIGADGWQQRLPGGPNVSVTKAGGEEVEVVRYLPDHQADGGPVYKRLAEHFREIQQGTGADPFGWRVEVQEDDGELARHA